MRVKCRENDRHHENAENDEDNLGSYKQEAGRWISGNHGNHGIDENHENPGCKPRVPPNNGFRNTRFEASEQGIPPLSVTPLPHEGRRMLEHAYWRRAGIKKATMRPVWHQKVLQS